MRLLKKIISVFASMCNFSFMPVSVHMLSVNPSTVYIVRLRVSGLERSKNQNLECEHLCHAAVVTV